MEITEIEETMEEIKHYEEEEITWLSYISLSTAIIAIFAAITTLYPG